MKKSRIFILILAMALAVPLNLHTFATTVFAADTSTISVYVGESSEGRIGFFHNHPGAELNLTSPDHLTDPIATGSSMADAGLSIPVITSIPTGYTLAGWNTEGDGSGDEFTVNTPMNSLGGIRVFAMWDDDTTGGGTPPPGGGGGPGGGGIGVPPGTGVPAAPGDGADGTGTADAPDTFVIEDGPVPLGALTGDEASLLDLFDIADLAVPLGAFEGDGELTDIEDGRVPLGAMPQTGLADTLRMLILGILALALVSAGTLWYIRKLKKATS